MFIVAGLARNEIPSCIFNSNEIKEVGGGLACILPLLHPHPSFIIRTPGRGGGGR